MPVAAGESIELTCGYQNSPQLKLRRLEWYRVTPDHSSLLFVLTGEGSGRVYGHDWLERRRTAFYSETRGGLTVVKLVLHQVEQRLSGQLQCQIIMQLAGKESLVLVPAVRAQRITVLERPQLEAEAEVRLVEAGRGVECEAPGNPAPHLSWHHLELSHSLRPVSEDKVETLPLEVQADSGLQVSRERLYRLEEGEFVCLVEGRGQGEAHRLSVTANLSWEYTGRLHQADQTAQPDILQTGRQHQQQQELIIAVTCLSLSLASLCLIACCLCRRSCRRSSNTQIYYNSSANKRTLSRHSRYLRKVKYYSDYIAGQQRSAVSTRSSMKRKAPRPGGIIGDGGTAFL